MGADQVCDENVMQDGKGCVFLIDKPVGISSFSVVRQVRRLLGIKKVGHAGTLDPFATGLLIVCAGRPATRMIDQFMGGRKQYTATLQLGIETDTLDTEGKIIATASVPELSTSVIEETLRCFTGKLFQAPPFFSAAKYKGKPLYYYARKGIEIEKDAREIEIFSLHCNRFNPLLNQLDITVSCSKGTYIRVLAADIGKELGCGAHLIALRRLCSGNFSVRDSLQGEKLSGDYGLETLKTGMLTLEQAQFLLDGNNCTDKCSITDEKRV